MFEESRNHSKTIFFLAGTIPGPILFGHLIDRSCLLFQDACGSSGACAIYENSAMGMNIFRVMISVKSASIVFFFCASLSNKVQTPPANATEMVAVTQTGKSTALGEEDEPVIDVEQNPLAPGRSMATKKHTS